MAERWLLCMTIERERTKRELAIEDGLDLGEGILKVLAVIARRGR